MLQNTCILFKTDQKPNLRAHLFILLLSIANRSIFLVDNTIS